jgi:hypothetical protein
VNDDITCRIEDTDEHGVGVQIDAAVKLVLLRVELHGAGILW